MHCNDVILTYLNFVGVLEFAVSNPGGIYVHHCNSTKFCHNFLQENVRETHTLGLISLPLGLALINSRYLACFCSAYYLTLLLKNKYEMKPKNSSSRIRWTLNEDKTWNSFGFWKVFQ